MRAPYLLLVVALAAPLPAASAKPVRVAARCHLIDDAARDVSVRDLPYTAGRTGDSVDIRTADVLVDTKSVTAVAQLPSADPATGTWRFTFTAGRTPIAMTAHIGTAGASFSAEIAGERSSAVHGAVTASELRIVAPLSVFRAAAPKRGTVISRIALEANDSTLAFEPDGQPPTDAYVLVDRAVGRGSFTVGKPFRC